MSARIASSEWRDTTLSDLCSFVTDGALPSESGAPIYVGLEHVESGAFRLNRSAAPADFKSNSYRFVCGDVLYGKLRPYLDKAVVAPSDGVCSTEILVLRPKPEIPVEFILAILHSSEFIAYAQSSADKQYPRTSWSWISQYSSRLPNDPNEQRKIAVVLGKVQAAVETEGELIRVTRELKQAALRQLFTRGLPSYAGAPEGRRGEPQKETEIGPVPESWNVVPLSYFGRIGNGSTPRRTDPSYWTGGTIPWLTSAKAYDRVVENAAEFVTPKAAVECHLPKVPRNSLIIAITGQGKTLGHVARVAIETCISQHLAYVTMERPDVVPDFVRQYLDTRYAHFRQVAMGGGSTKGALTCSFLKSYPVPLPKDEAEQREIAGLLQTIDAKLAHHEARQKLLRELFRTLLRDLLTARRRVPEELLSVC
ncbi:MAG: restriction endonuclease subunit S [Opitutaceae bacterium]|nr:restriction endonuclease subunit S [Opitutaceae bacterium]